MEITEWLNPLKNNLEVCYVFIKCFKKRRACVDFCSHFFKNICCVFLNLGRLTFNPFAHLDLFGTIMLFLFGIGYANPVPVQTRNFRNPKKGMIVTALAGPGSNLLMAFVFICLYYIVLLLPQNLAVSFIAYFFDFAATVNVSLAVFNLLPIPPLDGSKVIGFLIPSKTYFKILQYERYIMIALLLLLFTGVLNMPIALISDLLMKVISFLPSLIYNLIV